MLLMLSSETLSTPTFPKELVKPAKKASSEKARNASEENHAKKVSSERVTNASDASPNVRKVSS
jgi:hypothetical protein